MKDGKTSQTANSSPFTLIFDSEYDQPGVPILRHAPTIASACALDADMTDSGHEAFCDQGVIINGSSAGSCQQPLAGHRDRRHPASSDGLHHEKNGRRFVRLRVMMMSGSAWPCRSMRTEPAMYAEQRVDEGDEEVSLNSHLKTRRIQQHPGHWKKR